MRWRDVVWLVSFVLFPGGVAFASPDIVQRATPLYQRTEYEASLRVLASDAAPDAANFALTGKNYFMLGRYREAGESFKRAISLAPLNAEYVLWMGRTWGRKAEKGSVVTAPMDASEARRCFEKAVMLDPGYREAINDLFNFYLEAPGFLAGGGLDKAEAMAQRTKPLSPAEYEFDEAQLDLKRKNPAGAESHFRKAFDLAPAEPGRALDMARFLARHGRAEESEIWFERAEKAAPGKPSILFARAEIYIETRRHTEQARTLLRQYLDSPITPDDPPRESAEKLLRQATAAAG